MLPISTTSTARKVLIIAYYFPPLGLSGVQRILKFTKYLPDFGWQPIVLTVGNTKYYAFDEGLLNELQNKDISIYRTPATGHGQNKYPSKWLQKIGRAVLQTIFIPDSRKRWQQPALKLGSQIFKEHPDIALIFATAPPFTDLIVAQKLAEQYDIPFVADYRDLWTDNPQSFFPTPYHKYKHQALEYNIVRQCRKIIVITRTMKDKLMARYKFLDYNDITVISHGFDAEDFSSHSRELYSNQYGIINTPSANLPSASSLNDEFAGHKNNKEKSSSKKSSVPKNTHKKLVIMHCGIFPDSRTPKYFLKAVAQFLRKTPAARQDIELHFVGIMRSAHARLIKRYKLTDCTVLHGQLSHLEAVMQLQKADVNWMMIDNNIETPGKFYEYIGAAKPILLCAPDGELRQIGKDYGACFACNPKDIATIEHYIKLLYNNWQQNKMPQPNVNYIKTFSRHTLTGSLAKELAFLISD